MTHWSSGAWYEVRNEALFVSVGYRSGYLGHWAHEELAREAGWSFLVRARTQPGSAASVQSSACWIQTVSFQLLDQCLLSSLSFEGATIWRDGSHVHEPNM